MNDTGLGRYHRRDWTLIQSISQCPLSTADRASKMFRSPGPGPDDLSLRRGRPREVHFEALVANDYEISVTVQNL